MTEKDITEINMKVGELEKVVHENWQTRKRKRHKYLCTKNNNPIISRFIIFFCTNTMSCYIIEVFLEMTNLIFEVKQGLAMLVLGWVTALCCS